MGYPIQNNQNFTMRSKFFNYLGREELLCCVDIKVFFTGLMRYISLCLALIKDEYLVTAALRKNRTKNCPLPKENNLKKKGRRFMSTEQMQKAEFR